MIPLPCSSEINCHLMSHPVRGDHGIRLRIVPGDTPVWNRGDNRLVPSHVTNVSCLFCCTIPDDLCLLLHSAKSARSTPYISCVSAASFQ